jgi:hypothetical protein
MKHEILKKICTSEKGWFNHENDALIHDKLWLNHQKENIWLQYGYDMIITWWNYDYNSVVKTKV